MDKAHAAQLLARARTETEVELARNRAQTGGEHSDPADDDAGAAQTITERGTDEAMNELLSRRLEAIARAEQRLAEGSYGRSVDSGDPIPDGRLEIEPWAELTVAEQERV